MSRDFRESDWRVLRQLHPIALERFCGTSSMRFKASPPIRAGAAMLGTGLCDLIRRHDRELTYVFDDMRRSTALIRLFNIQVAWIAD